MWGLRYEGLVGECCLGLLPLERKKLKLHFSESGGSTTCSGFNIQGTRSKVKGNIGSEQGEVLTFLGIFLLPENLSLALDEAKH